MEGVTCTLQSFNVVTSDLYLANFVPQGDLWVLYCAHGIELSPGKLSPNWAVLKYA